MEATGNWPYLYECWEDLVEEIQMAHSLKTKAIASAKIKTDRIDDGILAHLGMADLVPQAYIPPRELRDLREILTCISHCLNKGVAFEENPKRVQRNSSPHAPSFSGL
jgi:hypothetical protein